MTSISSKLTSSGRVGKLNFLPYETEEEFLEKLAKAFSFGREDKAEVRSGSEVLFTVDRGKISYEGDEIYDFDDFKKYCENNSHRIFELDAKSRVKVTNPGDFHDLGEEMLSPMSPMLRRAASKAGYYAPGESIDDDRSLASSDSFSGSPKSVKTVRFAPDTVEHGVARTAFPKIKFPNAKS